MLGVSMRLPEQADLGAALTKFIQANYTADELKNVSKGISDVQLLRTRMVGSVSRNAQDQDHATTLATFISYYKLLTCLTARFPFQSASGASNVPQSTPAEPTSLLGKVFSKVTKKETQVSFPTTWFDAFRHSCRLSDIDIAFEKYSVLFNIASLLSRQATQIKSSVVSTDSLQASAGSDSSLKESCRLFQLSSGLFEYLSKVPEIVGGSLGQGQSLDLNSDSLSMLSVLMLAQAQACFFEKSTTTASPALVAKLAQGVSALFQDACARCEKNLRLKAIAAKNDVYPWSQHCAYQMYCYQAAGHYWMAKAILAEETEYGLEIAHLERARMTLAQAVKHEVGLLRNLGENRVKLEQALATRLRSAIKDNETIYYSTVPKPESIPNPDALTPVKPLTFFDIPGGINIDPSKDDPFLVLVSPYLREQHDLLRNKILEVQTSLSKKVTESEQLAKAALEAMGLPASLDALGDGVAGLPEDVWVRIQETQFKGGVNQLKELSARIETAVIDSQNAFQAAYAQLTKEAEMDDQLRAQFSHRWNRRPSQQLTVNFQRDAESIKRFLRDADTSNTKVRSELENCLPKFELLALPLEQLNEKLPRATAEQSQQSQQSVANLRTLMAGLAENTAAMKKVVSEFENKLNNTDLMAVLLAASTTHAPPVVGGGGAVSTAGATSELIATQLVPFAAFNDAVIELDNKQADYLRDITMTNQSFLTYRSQDDSTKRRQMFLQELNTTLLSFGKLLANFNEGLKFYSDLLQTKISPFQQKISDFCLARDMESKLILEQLTKDVAGYKEEEKRDSVFPNAAMSGIYSGSSAPPQQQSAPSSAHPSAASNPNLSFEPSSQLYHMNATPSPQSPQPSPYAQPPQQYQPQQQQQGFGNPFQQPAHPPQQPFPNQLPFPGHSSQPQQSQPMNGIPYGFQPPPSHQQPQSYQPHPVSSPYASPYGQQQQPQYQSPQPQPHQPTASGQRQWTCSSCTFINQVADGTCAMCGNRRT